MASNEHSDARILGSLRSADGVGIVRIEDRYDTGIDDLWSALTDPGRLAGWYGQVAGDLRTGGEFRLFIEVRGVPLDKIAFYGAGWQIHAESLAAFLAGRERSDTEARWGELVPPYQDLAAKIG